ncbi:MAG: 5-(carboxyamino)imidazole ribonucleotide mutase [Thermostichales cyanobacterium SZTDM-1c_bins_54]
MADVAIVMGSDSDLPVMGAAAQACQHFQVPHEMHILSAHRTPLAMVTFAQAAHEQGIRVIIAGAGGAAHLPGMVAALTPLPVIGVPVPTPALQGIDALLSIVQMPKGIPVATVAIGNAWNAGLLAVQMLASGDPQLRQRLQAYRRDLAEQVREKEALLQQVGWAHYPLP